jgi:ABC-2 type transport system permease protein
MKAFISFTKKEFTENLRTYRMVILAAVFIFLGILSPLTAKLLPVILKSLGDDTGIFITFAEPGARDSWQQFFGNVGQMGMLALIITFCGIMANELSRGTLVNLLTKGMKRRTVIISKFISASAIWTASYLLCLAVCSAYTAFYWPETGAVNIFPSFFSPWLFGEFLIALLIFGGTVFGSFYGSLLTCGGVVLILNLINIAPAARKYNPTLLASDTFNLLYGGKTISDYSFALVICAISVILLLLLTVVIFNKKKV